MVNPWREGWKGQEGKITNFRGKVNPTRKLYREAELLGRAV
jgi:hypothetical protein